MLFSVSGFIGNSSNHAGQAEKDYWSAIRGGQDKYKDSRGNRGRYDLFATVPCWSCFQLYSLLVLVLV